MLFSVAVNPSPTATVPRSEPAFARPLIQIVAIAGASGSGKTYLSTYVAKRLRAPVLSFDSYYLDLAHLSLAERAQWNFDHPASLDWPLLRSQLAALREGLAVDVPIYDFSTHTRSSQVCRVQAGEYLVLEGIFALHDAEVRSMLSVGVFIEFQDDGCLGRQNGP